MRKTIGLIDFCVGRKRQGLDDGRSEGPRATQRRFGPADIPRHGVREDPRGKCGLSNALQAPPAQAFRFRPSGITCREPLARLSLRASCRRSLKALGAGRGSGLERDPSVRLDTPPARRKSRDATWHDRPRPHGRQHGRAPDGRQTRPRRLRHASRRRCAPCRPRRRRRVGPQGFCRQAEEAARGLAHGSGSRRRSDPRSGRPAARARRHPDRRRQLLLSRRHPPRGRTEEAGAALRRRRRQRRRLGQGARLLPHDRRRGPTS